MTNLGLNPRPLVNIVHNIGLMSAKTVAQTVLLSVELLLMG